MKKTLLLSIVVGAAACRGGDSKPVDSSLARDLALASQVQTGQPQFQDTVTAPVTTQRAPQRISSAPRTRVTPRQPIAQSGATEPSRGMIGAGSSFSLASQQRICTSTNRPG